MITGLTSIIIPTYNHGRWILDSVQSALEQTAQCEVIVVDDGSTDDTRARLSRYSGRVQYVEVPHGGPSAARNVGIERSNGEFVMFLDADDVLERKKVERQLSQFSDAIGWVVCDVRVEDEANGCIANASAKYGYAQKFKSHWLARELKDANFIPIMAPLVRRSVLGDSIRFRDEHVPEDWHFWREVAQAARARYLPEVLATYRHRRTGRSRLPKAAREVTPYFEQPRRLNLGCGVKGTTSWHPIQGHVNLDKSTGWRFEDGLSDFVDATVFGITISHALAFVDERHWPRIFGELARVLAPGGVLRITEDETMSPASSRRGGRGGADQPATLTDAAKLRRYMERAGFTVHDVGPEESRYRDRSLCQANNGSPPDVFFIEGVRDSAVLFTPHADDETLFAAFTILRYRPRVIICFPSSGDYGDTQVRLAESRDAAAILGAPAVEQWPGDELVARMRELKAETRPARIFAPSQRSSHPDHVAVARAADEVFGCRLTTYQTYVGGEKVRDGIEVPFETYWLQHKLRALARYTSQLSHPRAYEFFAQDLREYYESEGA